MKSISTVVRKAAVETRVVKIDRRFLKVRVRPARFRRHLVGFETPLTSVGSSGVTQSSARGARGAFARRPAGADGDVARRRRGLGCVHTLAT
jgi:hypothetical protein